MLTFDSGLPVLQMPAQEDPRADPETGAEQQSEPVENHQSHADILARRTAEFPIERWAVGANNAFGLFTGPVTELPPIPSNPEDLKAWVESLDPSDLKALTQSLISGPHAGSRQAGDFGPRNAPIELPPPLDEPTLLTLCIELRESDPRIWRRLTLPGDLTLDAVHTLFQAAMGWSESHLHRFQPGPGQPFQGPYFITEYDEQEGDEGTREKDVRLDQVLRAPGDSLVYLYDFGDGWEHLVTLESLRRPTPDESMEPQCLDGANACPVEDVGGIWSHQGLAAWLRAGSPTDKVPQPFEDAEHVRRWLPADYDPDAFDPVEATEAMRQWAVGEHLPWHGLPQPLVDLIKSLRGPGWEPAYAWMAALGPRHGVSLDDDAVLRAARPWIVVLRAISPQTRLTAAGYLPPAVVRQIADDAGITEKWVGKANREDMVWPVAAMRETAQSLGLLRKAKGTLTPTARARAVSDNPRKLVATVLARLPLGKGFEVEAGWFALLGLAAGVSGEELNAGLAQILTDRGWRTRGSSQVDPADAGLGAEPTLEAMAAMTGAFMATEPALGKTLARAALLGVAEQAD